MAPVIQTLVLIHTFTRYMLIEMSQTKPEHGAITTKTNGVSTKNTFGQNRVVLMTILQVLVQEEISCTCGLVMVK